MAKDPRCNCYTYTDYSGANVRRRVQPCSFCRGQKEEAERREREVKAAETRARAETRKAKALERLATILEGQGAAAMERLVLIAERELYRDDPEKR